MKRVLEGNDDASLRSVMVQSPGARELDRVFYRLAARGQKEDPVVRRIRREGGEEFCELRSLFVDEAVAHHETLIDYLAKSPADLLSPVACVGDDDARGPVDPLVPPPVHHLEAFCALPDDGRLPHHGG